MLSRCGLLLLLSACAGSAGESADAAVLVGDAGAGVDASVALDASVVIDAGPDFSVITADAGGTAGPWSFGACPSPCTGSRTTLFDGGQAGFASLTFTQLVVDHRSGDAFAQTPAGLWSRWNGVDQWTPEVTGDPRSPSGVPELGPNRIANPEFADGMKHWFVAMTGDVPCRAPCSYAVEDLNRDAGMHSLHLSIDAAHPGGMEVGTFVAATPGTTYLISVWSTGSSGGSMHDEHDVAVKLVNVLPTRGWVQSFCKFVAVNPSGGQIMLKVYPYLSLNVTDFYAGEVDAGYPAPPCQLQYR